MENREITIVAIMISFPMAFGLLFQAHQAFAQRPEIPIQPPEEAIKAPVAVSGNNIYTAWNNASASLHGDAIFFTKSNDGGKTFSNAMVLSPPNTNPKVSVTRNNVNIGASGNNIAVTWWTNETGAPNPVIRTSTDGGNTFGNLIRLNSTSGEVNNPSGTNMTGAAGNTTAAHGTSIHTTNPAAYSTHDSGRSIRNVK
jgi:hypothetical protein